MKRKEMHYCQQVDGNVHKIFLYDDISKYGEWNWETWDYDESETSAAHFQKLLEAVPDGEEIELHINSYGGSVSEGTAIYNLLQESKAHKVGIVDGVCHSIAFTILQGCDERIMGYVQARLSTTCGPASQEMQNSSGKRRTSWTCVWNPVCS